MNGCEPGLVLMKRLNLVIANHDPSNVFAVAQLLQMFHVTEYSPAKTGETPSDIPQFSKLCVCEKYLKDNKHHSLHLASADN